VCQYVFPSSETPCAPCSPLQVRVLQCVSVAVELVGDKLQPHLATITNALPQVVRVLLHHTQRRVCCLTSGRADLFRSHAWLLSCLAELRLHITSSVSTLPRLKVGWPEVRSFSIVVCVFTLLWSSTSAGLVHHQRP